MQSAECREVRPAKIILVAETAGFNAPSIFPDGRPGPVGDMLDAAVACDDEFEVAPEQRERLGSDRGAGCCEGSAAAVEHGSAWVHHSDAQLGMLGEDVAVDDLTDLFG